MECIYLKDAHYLSEYKIMLTFNTDEEGVVDLKDLICSSPAAKPLRDKNEFANFYLDAWPTLAWKCGFDVAPESLYERAVKSAPLKLVAQEEPKNYAASPSSHKFSYNDLEGAFFFADAGRSGENSALICKDTGKILCRSELSGEDEIEAAEEEGTLNWDESVEMPNKNDLDLGQDLIFEFIGKELPHEYDRVRDIFRRKGAYSRYKDFLERYDMLDQWHEFENRRLKEALLKWCNENGIEIFL